MAVTREQDRKAEKARKERERRARIKAEKEAATAPESPSVPEGAPRTETPESPAAPSERSRRDRRPRDPEAAVIARRAKEIAPGIKSAYQAPEARSLMTIVGARDPIEFAFQDAQDSWLGGREPREVLFAWANGQLESGDEAARFLRLRVREISRDERARNLWGRKVAALLLAIDESRAS